VLTLESAFNLLLVVCCGFVVGGLAGMLGVGGSFLLVPMLHVLLGVPIETAVGSTACQLLGPATTSLLARRISLEQFRLPLILAGGIFVGVMIGTMFLEAAGAFGQLQVGGRSVPAVDLLVMSVYLFLLTGIGSFSLFEVHRQKQGRMLPRGFLARVSLPPVDVFPELGVGQFSIPVLSLFGLMMGLTAGLLGISGAILLLPGMIYLLGIRSKNAILASLVVVWITSLQATLFHAWHENVDLYLAVALMFGGTIGARLGSELSNRLQGQSIRTSLGWLALLAAALVVFRLWRLLA
jgi:uncharacterized membrane protein YfcA